MRTEGGPRAIRLPFPRIRQAEQLSFLCEARAATAVVEASTELGILDRLNPGPVNVASLADECGISGRAAASLLAALDSLGLATRHADWRTGDVVLGRRPEARVRPGLTGSGRPGIRFLHSVLAAMSAVSPGRRTAGPAGHSVLHNCPQGRDARHVA